MFRLTCATRDYAWGSPTLIPRFLGVPADGSPHAELWIGAHPGAPSRLQDGRTLDELLKVETEAALGPRVSSMFGDRLPFLMKALAAAEPLSLQVHPTSERARLGYAHEDSAGIRIGAANRNYQDEFHKPELLFAITRFEGMAGFRDVEKSARILRLLELPWADTIAERLQDGPAYQSLRTVVAEILTMPPEQLVGLLGVLAGAARRAEERGHGVRSSSGRRYLDRDSVEREATRAFAQTASLAARYPRDPGVLVTLLLNHVVLAPGEALFLDAGVVHAYASGFGVEVMAASDNVVRAGLTPKHVDVPELLQIASFTPIPPPLWMPTSPRDGVLRFDAPVSEFTLSVVRSPIADVVADGPRLLLVIEGEVEAQTAAGSELLGQGDTVFVAHAEGPLSLRGSGRVAIAGVPD
jgi:mannose-6-phosphate isomerase